MSWKKMEIAEVKRVAGHLGCCNSYDDMHNL